MSYGFFSIKWLLEDLRKQKKSMIGSGLYTEEEYKEYMQRCVSDLEWRVVKREREQMRDCARLRRGY